MASRTVSPGGALLRSSRMFSVPPPLPRPEFRSDSGTLPYPTHLSIATPCASLQRGDWGLKRALPLRSTTKTSTPMIRVETLDTLEHITEFRSSADHGLTLQKWQEMDIPLTITPAQHTGGVSNPHNDAKLKSVFEDDVDSTTDEAKGIDNFDTRWKFKGPWLGNQGEGDFAEYLKKEIRTSKTEFRQYLRTQLAASMTAEAKEKRRDAGGNEYASEIKATDVSEAQLNEYIKRLRKDVKSLYLQIRNFLDLAPVATDDKLITSELKNYITNDSTGKKDFVSEAQTLPATLSPYAVGGPPITHPSAGLSYSRTMARTFNHPEFGPQANRPPVEARIIGPKARHFQKPAIGVGGFVADVPFGDATFKTDLYNMAKGQAPSIPGLVGIDPKKVGGAKTWVHPKSASINAEGKVVLVVSHGDPDAVAVKEGTTDKLLNKRRAPAGGFKPTSIWKPEGVAQGRQRTSFGLEGSGQRSPNKNPSSELASLLGGA